MKNSYPTDNFIAAPSNWAIVIESIKNIWVYIMILFLHSRTIGDMHSQLDSLSFSLNCFISLGAVFSVSYDGERDLLVSGSADKTVRLWQLSTARQINMYHGHHEWVTKVINLRYNFSLCLFRVKVFKFYLQYIYN